LTEPNTDAPITDAKALAEQIAVLTATVRELLDVQEKNPDSLYPALADNLMQLSAALSSAGMVEQALKTGAEGVEQFRQLAEQEPKQFMTALAASLNSFSTRLDECERHDDAGVCGGEAVALAKQAMEEDADRARYVLVSALVNQAGRRLREGDKTGVVAELESAVQFFVEGGEAGEPFLGPMIEALHRTAMSFAELGLWQEAVQTRRMLCTLFGNEVPPQIVHLLALTQSQAALALSRDGKAEEALELSAEAVAVGRVLHENDADAYGLYLAQALGSLAGRLHEAGKSEPALEIALEAVNLFQDCAEKDPENAVPSLVLTLESLVGILSSQGLTEQAETVKRQHGDLQKSLETLVAARRKAEEAGKTVN
jgi:tetratricopeptide (TPR) repeat protein